MKNNNKIIFFFVLFHIISINLKAQEYNYPLNNNLKNEVLFELNIADTIVHSSFYPIRVSYTEHILNKNNIFYNPNRTKFANKLPLKWFWRKLLAEELIEVNKKDIKLCISPLLIYYKQKLKDEPKKYSQNTRGIMIKGTLGKKISFYSDFFENQSYFIPYIDADAERNLIAPGQGAWKIFGTDKKGKDYSSASGYISYTPLDFLNIQVGHSKHFVGSGYRSVLLSDNTFNYPFAKITLTHKKLQYTMLFAEFQSFKTKYYSYHHRKHSTINYLNYSPFRNVEIGLFEGIIWQTSDDSTYQNKIPVPFFVPIIGVREAIYGMRSNHNIILGLNTKISPVKFTEIYGQLAFDQLSDKKFGSKTAYQVGIKIYDAFINKIKNIQLFLQVEYNYSAPYTYTHEISHQSYTHYNAPLAHPSGAGFNELLARTNLKIYNFIISYQFDKIIKSIDNNGSNFGSDIQLSNLMADYKSTDNNIGQGAKATTIYNVLDIAYVINPVTNFQIFASLTQRNLSLVNDKNKISFVSFGIRNSLKNYYYNY